MFADTASTSIASNSTQSPWIFCARRGQIVLRKAMETTETMGNETLCQGSMVTKAEKFDGISSEYRKRAPELERLQRRQSIRGEDKKGPIEITLEGTHPTNLHFALSGIPSCLDLNFETIRTLGKGSFGEVSKVKFNQTGRFFAMKISKIQSPTFKYQEVHALQSLPVHQNIIKLYRAWEETSKLYMQMELCEQSLLKYSIDCKGVSDMDEAWNYVVDLVQAVNHMHRNGMIHADIKPANVMLTKDRICKLGDFGLAIDTHNPKYAHRIEEGDSQYLAPEVINHRPTMASDVYALGLTILEVVTDLHIPRDLEPLHNWQIPERIFGEMPKNMREMVRVMMARDPEQRPTSKELMEHPDMESRIGARNRFIKEVEEKNESEELLRLINYSPPEIAILSTPSTFTAPEKKISPPRLPQRRLFANGADSSDDDEPLLANPRMLRSIPKQPTSAPGRMSSKDAVPKMAFRKLSVTPRSNISEAPTSSEIEPPTSMMAQDRKRQSDTILTPVRSQQCLKKDEAKIDEEKENENRTPPTTPVLQRRAMKQEPRKLFFF